MFYLKYRPQTIEELDLASVRSRLTNLLAQEDLPHAFLFSGPRGAGKTSAARIIAKIVNCKKSKVSVEPHLQARGSEPARPNVGRTSRTREEQLTNSPTARVRGSRGTGIEPCNVCESCRAIMQGRHLDIIEIDAASNRGIDQIRDLRDKIGLSPSSGDYKVYIIDEVHMLTKEAFNALLKTLEEPPEHAIFILATTEPYRLPDTVVSRCVEVPFPKATKKEVERALKRIVQGEDLVVEEGALQFIAEMSDGSFRDATKILEEATALSPGEIHAGQAAVGDGEVTLEKVEAIAGGGVGVIGEFLGLLGKKEVVELLSFVNKKVEKGTDPNWLIKATLDRLHEMFLAEYGLSDRDKTSGTDETNNFSKAELIDLMRYLERAAREAKNAVVPQMPLELAIIEWTGGEADD